MIPSSSTCIQQRAVHKVSPPAVFPLTQAPPDFEPVVWSEFSLFFSADFLEVDGVTYVIKDSVAYKDCPEGERLKIIYSVITISNQFVADRECITGNVV